MRTSSLLLLAGALAACGPSVGPRPDSPPDVPRVRPAPEEEPARTLDNGLRVVEAPGREGVFSAALLFPGGPLHDPTALPGLTEFMAEAATLATRGDPDDATAPHRRALLHGGELLVVADGRRVGWAVVGPREASAPLLRLLVDVGTRPSFPATRVQLRATLMREQTEAEGDAAVSDALALAVGLALGTEGPLPLNPTAEMLSGVNREDTLRHWRGLARPERGVLVLSGASPARREAAVDRLAGWRQEGEPASARRPCLPQGHAAHLVVDEEMPRTRAIVLLAAPAVPGPDREGLEALLAWFGRIPSGPVADLVGPDDARRTAPELIEVGLWGERRVAAILGGLGGDRDEVVGQVLDVADALAGYASDGAALDEDEAADAVRMARGRSLTADARPLRRLLAAAGRVMPDATQPATPDPEALRRVGAAHLQPHRYTYVALGPEGLEEALAEITPVSVWGRDGTLLRGPGPPRCLPVSPTISGQFSVDTHPAHR
ncbi:MAG: hypothetical protein ACQEXJ_09120 [Myxococcota bacterium]